MTRNTLAIILTISLGLGLLVVGCGPRYDPGLSRQTYEGAGVGAGVGAAAGALLDDDNRWRGGVIGGALGAVLGGAVTDIATRASSQAAYHNQPVSYSNQSGTQRVEAVPAGNRGNCQVVKEKYYEKGELVKVVEREVCN